MRLGDPQEIGRLMRERRQKLGFTITQMAQAVGLSPITIMRLELGRVSYVHEKTAKALEVPVRVTNRLVTTAVPVGVMADGSMRPVEQLGALPPDMRAVRESGDMEAQTPVQAVESRPRRLDTVRKPVKHIQASVAAIRKPKPMPATKRLLLWLADKI